MARILWVNSVAGEEKIQRNSLRHGARWASKEGGRWKVLVGRVIFLYSFRFLPNILAMHPNQRARKNTYVIKRECFTDLKPTPRIAQTPNPRS